MTHPHKDVKLQTPQGKIIRSYNDYKHYMVTSTEIKISNHNEVVEAKKRDKKLLKQAAKRTAEDAQ